MLTLAHLSGHLAIDAIAGCTGTGSFQIVCRSHIGVGAATQLLHGKEQATGLVVVVHILEHMDFEHWRGSEAEQGRPVRGQRCPHLFFIYQAQRLALVFFFLGWSGGGMPGLA